MTGLLLATLLNLSPGIQLADNVSARHVALSEARFPLLFVSDDEDAPRPSLDAMTREQLAVELRRLDENRPSLGGPIALLSVGVALCIPGAAIVVAGLGLAGFSGSSAGAAVAILFTGFGAVLLTVGVILAIVGGIKLATRISARRAHSEEVDEVRKKMDSLDQAVPPMAPPPPDMLPPPPPPPPPQANLVMPGPLQTVMTF